jgi:peptidyl-prolyl cis-trans isomerase B (cyclophilin B)
VASRQRERELARARYLRQQQRRVEEAARRRVRRNIAGAVVAVLAVVGGVFGVSRLISPGSSASAAASATGASSTSPVATTAPPAGCQYTQKGTAAKKIDIPTFNRARAITPYTATLVMNRGRVSIAMNAAKAPCAAYSFRHLAEKKFFDSTPCHRLTTEGIFVLQCGDPTGSGTGGPGYTFPDENLAGATYPAGTIAMANSGPNTNGSQFFLVYKNTKLPPQYIPFGTITTGLDTVTTVAKAGATPAKDGKPVLSTTITTVSIS